MIYLVSGPRSYLSELQASLASLRRHEPELPVTVFSRSRLPRGTRADHAAYDSELHPLKQKVLVLAQSPYDHTLFLDTDTTVLGPIRQVFDYLEGSNFVAARASEADYSSRPPRLIGLVHPREYNTGVLLYDSSAATGAFLERWAEAVIGQDESDMWAGHNCDQSYFNRIVAAGAPDACGLSFATMPNTVYNVRGLMVDEMKRLGIWNDALILHHRTRRMKARKVLFSATDPTTLLELGHKALQKARRGLRLGADH